MKNRTFPLLIIFSIYILTGCVDEYTVHYRSEHPISTSTSATVFSGEKSFVQPDVFVLPDRNVRSSLIEYIDGADERVWIEIYTWTDKTLLEAVIRAHRRGVDVKVVLEPNVYGSPTINKGIFASLSEAGIAVVYADTYRYTFTHAKLMIVDNRYFISTGNFTQSFFTKNRDFIFSDTGVPITSFLALLFSRDFHHQGVEDLLPIPDNLVISPINSRQQIITLIKSAKNQIIVYTQTLQDSEILDVLSQTQQKGIDVAICTAKNETNTLVSHEGEFIWNKIIKPYLHTKVIFIDSDAVFVGSQNLTTNSLDNNREIGIIIRNNSILFGNLMRIYRDDCTF